MKLSSCSKCCVFFWVIPGVLIFCADVSEHSVCLIFRSVVSGVVVLPQPMNMELIKCYETSAHKIQTAGNHLKEKNTTCTLLA